MTDRQDAEWRSRIDKAKDLAGRAATFPVAARLGSHPHPRPRELVRRTLAETGVRLTKSALAILGVVRQVERHGHPGLRVDAARLAGLAGCSRSTAFVAFNLLEEAELLVRVTQYEYPPEGGVFVCKGGLELDKRQAANVYRCGPKAFIQTLAKTFRGLMSRALRTRRAAVGKVSTSARFSSGSQGVRKPDSNVSLRKGEDSAGTSPRAVDPDTDARASRLGGKEPEHPAPLRGASGPEPEQRAFGEEASGKGFAGGFGQLAARLGFAPSDFPDWLHSPRNRRT